jgi:hypothetical protein
MLSFKAMMSDSVLDVNFSGPDDACGLGADRGNPLQGHLREVLHRMKAGWKGQPLSPVVCAASLTAMAQACPTKPIRIIVPFPAGSIADTIARVVGQKLAELFAQQVVAQNHPGADGALAQGGARLGGEDRLE